MLPPFKAGQVHGILEYLYSWVGKPRMLQATCLSAYLSAHWGPLLPSVAPIVAPVPLCVFHHHPSIDVSPGCFLQGMFTVPLVLKPSPIGDRSRRDAPWEAGQRAQGEFSEDPARRLVSH